jgi:hypothetical protein
MLTRAEIWSEFQENYRYAHDYWSPFVSNAQVYTLAASGYTWSQKEREQLSKEGREPLELNIMRRPLEFFSGYLRDNLNSIVFAPVEGSDQKTADQLTKLSYYTWDKGNGYATFLDAADECFKAGMSLCGLQMDYSRDFVNGDLSFYKRTFNQFYLDPTFESISLGDCGFAVMRDLLDRTVIKQLIPFVDPKEIDAIQNAFRDDKFLSYHPNFTTLSRNRNLMAYDQYYKRTTRRRKFLVDEESSFFRDITDLEPEKLRMLKFGLGRLRSLHNDPSIDKQKIPPILDIREVDRPFIELHIMLNGQEVYNGEDKTGIVENFPFVPLICYMEPSIWMPSQRVQGIAATQYFNQRNFVKRHMKIVDMMDSDISKGFQYMIGAVADPQDLQQSGQNKIIGLDPDDPSVKQFGQDAVRQLTGGGANQSLIEYQAVLDKLSLTLANINETTLGIDEGGNTQVSGKLAQVRLAQGLRANRKIMDNIESAQKFLGALVGKGIQLNMPAGKVKRIIGEDPTEQFYDREFEQYDAVIKEGVRSQSQRDAYYYELIALKRDGIVNVPEEEIVRALQMAGLSDLEEAIAKQAESQKQVQQLAMQAQQLQIEVLNATKEEKLGLAEERKSRVISNLSLKDERESEAQQNIAQAALDRAKTITEIAKMHDDRILQVLQFVNALEQQEAAGREIQKQQVETQSHRINSDTQGSAENKQASAQASPQQSSDSSLP